MALSQVYTAVAGHTITAARWNDEFGNILNNGTDVGFPLTKSVSFAGYTITWDAAGNTTMIASASAGLAFAPGAKTGTPSTTGGLFNSAAATFTDNATAGSGTATAWAGWAIQRPTLAATNATVTTTDAATVYIAGGPTAGTNETITNSWAIRIADSDARTATVDVPMVIESTTSDTPAAGIGTGLRFRAESQDENPCEIGQVEFALSDVTTGSEDTYFQMLLRVAGAALTSCYRFAATGAFNAIFTHANTAARTYTLQDLSGTVSYLVLGTSVASTSGTAITFTGIPANTKRITVNWVGVSLSGTSDPLFRLGDAASIEATGYLGSAATRGSAASNYTTGFGLATTTDFAATSVTHGRAVFELVNAAAFTWTYTWLGGNSDAAKVVFGGGSKSLTGELTRVSMTTAGGSDTFDAGTINILYEV